MCFKLSLRETSKLTTIIIEGEKVAASAASTFQHGVGEGEYVFEYGLLKPNQDPIQTPTWVTLQFVPTYTSRDGRMLTFGCGFAEEDRHPMVIRGPIPFVGPGYFRATGINVNSNDSLGGTFSYRKVKRRR